jgi:thioredoxin-like negative regulator of GroEL
MASAVPSASQQVQQGQPLPLQRDFPGPGPLECPAAVTPVAPTDEERTRAGQLTSDAHQALISGDLEGARTLLSQATTADATSPEYAYRHARVLEALGVLDAAMVGGAVEAYVRARRARAAQSEAAQNIGAARPPAGNRLRIVGPSISASGARLDLNLLGQSFR